MHEVSIAQNILDIVEREADKNKANKIYSVKIVIGEFTGIVKEALEFALQVVIKNSIANKAEFHIEMVSLKTHCSTCNKTYNNNKEFIFLCPSCDGNLEILNGKELYIDYIDLE